MQVLLEDAGIGVAVFDGNMSAVQGTLGAVPQRLAVPERELGRLRAGCWSDADLGQWIVQ